MTVVLCILVVALLAWALRLKRERDLLRAQFIRQAQWAMRQQKDWMSGATQKRLDALHRGMETARARRKQGEDAA